MRGAEAERADGPASPPLPGARGFAPERVPAPPHPPTAGQSSCGLQATLQRRWAR